MKRYLIRSRRGKGWNVLDSFADGLVVAWSPTYCGAWAFARELERESVNDRDAE